MTSRMFVIVKDMNVAFGNDEGDPSNIDRDKLLRQCKNIGAEFVELMKTFGVEVQMRFEDVGHPDADPDLEDTRDALCDIMVFALGVFHFMGVDADEDMEAVIDGVMTRFCKDAYELGTTCAKYQRLGVEFTIHGEGDRMYLRSAKDQQMPEYPKGKFLKSVGYKEPVFKPLARPPVSPNPVLIPPVPEDPSIVAVMAAERKAKQAHHDAWQAYKKAAIAALMVDLDVIPESLQKDLLEKTIPLRFQFKGEE